MSAISKVILANSSLGLSSSMDPIRRLVVFSYPKPAYSQMMGRMPLAFSGYGTMLPFSTNRPPHCGLVVMVIRIRSYD